MPLSESTRKRIIEEEQKAQEEFDARVDQSVKQLFTKWMISVCRTSAVAIMGIAATIGTWIVNHSERASKALEALFGDGK